MENFVKEPILIANFEKIVMTSVILLMFYFFINLYYVSFKRGEMFQKTLKDNQITLIDSENLINYKEDDCPYKIHFNGLKYSGEKIRATYCAGNFFPATGQINIKEVF